MEGHSKKTLTQLLKNSTSQDHIGQKTNKQCSVHMFRTTKWFSSVQKPDNEFLGKISADKCELFCGLIFSFPYIMQMHKTSFFALKCEP
jgi:hypothetical protein